MKMNERLLELDALRGIAIFAVMLFHYTTRFNQLYGSEYFVPSGFPLGFHGVDLFFMISGFVICMTLEKCTNVSDFIVTRFSRLYPSYWAAIFIIFIVVKIFHLPGREVNFYDAILNFTMLQSWYKVPNVDGAFWALPVILVFYFWMGLFFKLRILKYIDMLCIGWLLLSLCNFYLLHIGIRYPNIIPSSLLILDNVYFFIAGILFYQMKRNGQNLIRCSALMGCLLVQCLYKGDLTSVIVTSCFFIVFFIFISGRLTFIRLRPLTYLGSISYCLYVIHQNIGYVIMRNLFSYNFDYRLIIVCTIFISLILASILTFYIEKPASVAIRRVYEKNS
jgi:peptidoglycan/LPS O-acetylase OafA/YrhL